jgi:hypothetical protein
MQAQGDVHGLYFRQRYALSDGDAWRGSRPDYGMNEDPWTLTLARLHYHDLSVKPAAVLCQRSACIQKAT